MRWDRESHGHRHAMTWRWRAADTTRRIQRVPNRQRQTEWSSVTQALTEHRDANNAPQRNTVVVSPHARSKLRATLEVRPDIRETSRDHSMSPAQLVSTCLGVPRARSGAKRSEHPRPLTRPNPRGQQKS